MITTREELINALHEASELEHGLLVQYLYAALSMKKRLDEGLTTRQQMLCRKWEAAILRVAHEEMGHLGTVCSLLAAIGSGPRFKRPNMPKAQGYYPFAFDLLPFSDEALHRFLVFELPRGLPLPPPPGADLRAVIAEAMDVAPDPIEYEFVGELYAKIAAGFNNIPEGDLFIGPAPGQRDGAWSLDIDMRLVEDRQSALDAIDDIIEDGEGTSQNREGSHYNRFETARQEYFDDGRFEAARRLPVNPATREQRDADGAVVLIKNPLSLRATELFNAAYGVMLLMLQHYFSLAPQPPTSREGIQRQALKLSAARIMSVAIRPMAEIVTELPLDDAAAPERAGPSFEIYGEIELSPYPAARWTLLFERLDAVISECAELSADLPRLEAIGETLTFLRQPLVEAARGGA